MKLPLRRLGWTLSLCALLAGCNGSAPEQSRPHPIATYTHATWKDLPTVSDSDLVAGFESWRSACERLKRDPVWTETCAAAANASRCRPRRSMYASPRRRRFGASTSKSSQ